MYHGLARYLAMFVPKLFLSFGVNPLDGTNYLGTPAAWEVGAHVRLRRYQELGGKVLAVIHLERLQGLRAYGKHEGT
jgi:hypothetical protein